LAEGSSTASKIHSLFIEAQRQSPTRLIYNGKPKLMGGRVPSADELSRLLRTLYATPMRPELWAVFLKDFADALSLPAAAILQHGGTHMEHRFEIAAGLDPSAMTVYEQYYSSFDSYLPRGKDMEEGELAFGEVLCPKSELCHLEFYNDFLLKYDFTVHCAIVTVKRPYHLEQISLYQSIRGPPLGSDAIAIVELIVPHIHAALRLQQHVRGIDLLKSNCEAALNRLPLGVVLVDARARCVFANQKAEALLRKGDGISLVENRLAAQVASETAALSELIQGVICVAIGSCIKVRAGVLLSRCTMRPLRVSAVALSRETPIVAIDISGVAVAAVFIHDPDAESRPLASLMTALYGLTATESRVAVLLYEGRTLAEVAALNDVARETIRTQLKAIFQKTDVRRQAQLLRLMAQLVTL
jgi:DNA-binding CsgD family transcriptional regulator/PAS domain-containing protein